MARHQIRLENTGYHNLSFTPKCITSGCGWRGHQTATPSRANKEGMNHIRAMERKETKTRETSGHSGFGW